MSEYRQEHIYEFIITEKHHCQLLKVTISSFSFSMSSFPIYVANIVITDHM